MKAIIYTADDKIIRLNGEVLDFFMGTKGWNLTLKGGSNENEGEWFDYIIKNERDRAYMFDPKYHNAKVVLIKQMDGTEWIGVDYSSGYRIQIIQGE